MNNYKSSVTRQKGEYQNGCFKKVKHAKISENKPFLTLDTHTYVLFLLLTTENLWFSDVFRGYRSGTSVENGLISKSPVLILPAIIQL